MRIFKNEAFTRFARKALISDADLCAAIASADRGLIDADLGSGVIKQRIARSGAGKSGGFRTIVLFKVDTRAFFVYGFGKNERANISAAELVAFKLLAKTVLQLTDAEIEKALMNRTFIEIVCAAQEETPDEEAVP